MRLLLDTHVFLRYFLSPKKIKRAALIAIEETDRSVFVSSASVWEMAIKSALRRLEVPGDLAQYVRHRLNAASFMELAVTIDHSLAVRSLPALHGDPFDRMLIAQVQVESLSLVTSDRQIVKYDVHTMLA